MSKNPTVGWTFRLWRVLASILGGALAGTLIDVGVPPVSFAAAGTVVGITQWLVLRRYIPHAGW